MKIHIDYQGIDNKLTNPTDIKMQVGRLRGKGSARIVDISTLAKEIGKGKAFITCTVKDVAARSLEAWNVKDFAMFCIDIDNSEGHIYTPKAVSDEVYGILGIKPAIYYDTFSSTKEIPRFRLIYVFDNPVEMPGLYQDMYRRLNYLFPYIDTQCSNPNRIWQGTNKKVYVNPKNAIINKDSFINKLKDITSEITIEGSRVTQKPSNIGYNPVKSYIRFDSMLNYQYKEEIVSCIKEQVDILTFVKNEGFVVINENDKYARGICPFHSNADNPHGFLVNKVLNKAYCLTHKCVGGDIFDLTQVIYNIGLWDSILKIVNEYNVNLEPHCYRKKNKTKDSYNVEKLFDLSAYENI